MSEQLHASEPGRRVNDCRTGLEEKVVWKMLKCVDILAGV